jgi:hypothetical protein
MAQSAGGFPAMTNHQERALDEVPLLSGHFRLPRSFFASPGIGSSSLGEILADEFLDRGSHVLAFEC